MTRKPFFMRFVETQDKAPVQTDVKAGAETRDRKPIRKAEYETMKYPSDGDDGWPEMGW